MIASLCFTAVLAVAAPSGVAAPDSAREAPVPPVDTSGTVAAPPRPVLVLPEVRVDRARPEMDAARRSPTGFVSDIPAGSTGHALETLQDLLGRSPTVRIQQYGGLGAFATLSVRGAPANQTTYYVDGTPLTSASQSVVNLSDLPASAIQRVEVYRSGSPLAFGPASPGGAVNIVTPSSMRGATASAVRGSFGLWEARGSAGARRGAWSGLVHAGYQGAEGDFGYRDDNGTPYNPADDVASTRQNNRFDAATLLATAHGDLPGGLGLTLRENLFDKRQGVPGLGSVPALHTRLELQRSLSQIDLGRAGSSQRTGFGVTVSADRSRTRFQDTVGELGWGPSDTDDHTGGEQYAARATSPRGAWGLVAEAAAAVRFERAQLHDDASGYADPPTSTRETRGAGLTVTLEPWRDRLLLTVGRRLDRQRDALRWVTSLGNAGASDVTRELDSPQVGARLKLTHDLSLEANASRSTRAPDFTELFGNEGSVRGNPTLEPERAQNWDAGVSWGFASGGTRRGSLDCGYYEGHPRDLIVYVLNSASSVRAENISRASIRGLELSGSADPTEHLGIHGWLTLQRTRDEGAVPAWHGKRLPLRVERHAFARLIWRARRFELEGEAEYLGEDFRDRANRSRVPARTLTGAAVSVRVAPDLRVTFEGRNLGNARVEDVAAFPLPGRSLFLSCRVGADTVAGRRP